VDGYCGKCTESFRINTVQEIYLLAERQLASQNQLCYMELVGHNY
jgi:hypothetical protein